MGYIPIHMDREVADPDSPPERTVRPSEAHAELALREAAVLMAPLARWLLRHGVPYPAFADMLKSVFVGAALDELESSGAKPTHSALSVLSGVHRKDVRVLQSGDPQAVAPRSVPLASAVFTRWISDPKYRANGKPRSLPRTGAPVSFETLARESSNDVHPRTVLDELVRCGLARVDGDEVVPLATSFVPSRKLDELTALFSANVSDHISAAVHNLTLKAPKYLEQSVFADGLTQASIDQLHQTARDIWGTAFTRMVDEARRRVDADVDADADIRMRFGVYFYSEPVEGRPAPTPPATARPKRSRRSP